jgi:hypothetical protein
LRRCSPRLASMRPELKRFISDRQQVAVVRRMKANLMLFPAQCAQSSPSTLVMRPFLGESS